MMPSGSANTTQRVTRVQSPVNDALDASMMPAQQAAAQLAAMAEAPNAHGVQHGGRLELPPQRPSDPRQPESGKDN